MEVKVREASNEMQHDGAWRLTGMTIAFSLAGSCVLL